MKVDFYNDELYNEFMQWPDGIKGRFMRVVQMLEEYGSNLGMPYTRSMCKGLFEIRAKGKEGIGRAFFCYIKDNRAIILHGFIKKTEKTPRKELRLAKRRMDELLRGTRS